MAADHPLTPLLNALQSALVPPTQAAAQLPSPSDLAFERTLSRKLARSLDSESDRILSLASRVLNWASPVAEGGGGGAFDADLVREGVYNPTTLRLEPLLEAADDAIDRHRGTGKHARKNGPGAAGAKSAEEMKEREKDRAKRERLPARLLHDSGLEKPQLRFTERCTMKRPKLGGAEEEGEGEDAAATVPPGEDGERFEGIPLWKPLLRRKVNAKDEDAPWLTTEIYSPSSSYTLTTHTSPPRYMRYSHPYAAELASLSPPSSLLAKPEQAPPPHKKDSFEKTPFEWVGDEEGLGRMVEEIRSAGEEGTKDLAIDLEHHDFRTWGGITCLMQLSTRKKDYVVDVLNPGVRDNLDSLNEFFTDASWVKVFHGASSDIIWLQRDFGLYIVGLFDTYHATKVLGYAQHSLASLLDMYTDFEPDKRYQLADWRIRPLPQEMLHYARSDTHYLLSIYDHLRLALHSKQTSSPPDASSPFPSHLEEVFHRSTLTSSSVFSLPPFDPLTGHGDSSFLPLLAKHGQLKSYATAVAVPTLPIKTGWGPGEGKLEVLRAVCTWRERTAREEDESVRYVLGQGGVWQLAELGGIGRVRDERDVMSALGGARGGVSEVVRRRKEELAEVVVAAFKQATGAARKDGEAEGEDVEMAAATAGTAPVQLGLPAEEPTVRPVQGLWDAPVASTSAAAVSVKTAAGSAFYGASSSSSSSTFPTSASPSVATASSSSFFGTSSLSTASTSTIASSVSKGKGKGKSPASIPRQTAADRAAAVSRVHASLVLGGGLAQSLSAHTIPSAVAAAPTETDVTLPDEPLDDQPTEQTPSTDHTYVPLSGRVPKPEQPSTLDASSRAPAYSKPDKNEVIVVSSLKDKGSAGGKKRKRVVASTSSSTASSAAMPSLNSPAAVAEAEVASPPPPAPAPKKPKLKKTDRAALAASLTPHDYSSAPSILDATGVGATGRQRREMEKREKKSVQREEKGRKEREGVDTSAFGRAPRVNNAPKKANKAHVFAK